MISFSTAQVQLATSILPANLNIGLKRPYIDDDGHSYVINTAAAKGQARKLQINQIASLRYDEWKDIDRVAIEAATQRLVGINDLRSRGLEHGLGNIGATVALWNRASHMTQADVSLSGTTQGEKDQLAFKTQFVSVPVIFKDFQIEMRQVAASRAFGGSLDTETVDIAARVVAEKSEQILFLGIDEIQLSDPNDGLGLDHVIAAVRAGDAFAGLWAFVPEAVAAAARGSYAVRQSLVLFAV